MDNRTLTVVNALLFVGVLSEAFDVLFFFFQAEDGIRDADVTGVQTCALPISSTPDGRRARTGSTCARGRTRGSSARPPRRGQDPRGAHPDNREAPRAPLPRPAPAPRYRRGRLAPRRARPSPRRKHERAPARRT